MRNLKRALSLGLTATMISGLMVMGSSAASYADVTSKQNQEAIEVLKSVGVMVGDEKGNFNPDTKVTRNEMAVVMSNLMDYTVASYKGTAPFTDVPDWAEPYVAACYTNGIIAGYSNTTFGGADSVTTGQAALMLEKALGYFESQADFGSDWLVEATKKGAEIELFDGVDNGAKEALTRNDLAQMVLNALEADVVDYTGGGTTVEGDGFVVNTGKATYESRTSTSTKYSKIHNEKDVPAGTQRPERYTVQLGEELYDGDLEKIGCDDAFGRPATEWKYDSQSIGTFADDSDLLKTYTAKASKGDLYKTVGSSVVDSLEDGDYTMTVYENGVAVADEDDFASYFVKNSSGAAGISGNGVLSEVYVDADHHVTIVMVNTYLMKATSDYNEKKEELSVETVEVDDVNAPTPALPTSISNDDFDVSSFKEDDYILVTYSQDTDAIESVQAAEVLTGSVSEYTETDYVIIDGTKYEYNKLVGDDESKVEYTIGEDAKVVLDAYGYIIFVDEAVSTSSYVYIQEADQAVGVGSKVAANAFFADGTNDVITLKKVAGNTDTTSLMGAGGWYTFIKDSADKYSLSTVKAPQSTTNGAVNTGSGAMAEATAAGATVVTNSKVDFLGGLGTVKANADTKFILLDADNEVYTYDGIENAPTVKVGADALTGTDSIRVNWIEKKGYATYVFIDTSDDVDAVIDDVNNVADYLFILKSTRNKTVVGEDTYYQYKVLFDGEETTKYIEESIVGSDAQGVMVYNVKANDKGYITSATTFVDNYLPANKQTHEVTAMTITEKNTLVQDGKTISVSGENGSGTDVNRDYIVNADTVMNLVVGKGCSELLKNDAADYELHANLSASALAGLVKGYELTATVYAVVDDEGSEVLDYLYVYVKNAHEAEPVVETYDLTIVDNTDKSLAEGYVKVQVGGQTVTTPGAVKLAAGNYSYTIKSTDKNSTKVLDVSGEVKVTKDGAAKITVPKFEQITISGTLPTGGTMKLDGVAVTPGASVYAATGEYEYSISGEKIMSYNDTLTIGNSAETLTLPTYHKVTVNNKLASSDIRVTITDAGVEKEVLAKSGGKVELYVVKGETVTMTVVVANGSNIKVSNTWPSDIENGYDIGPVTTETEVDVTA
ncbi:MAG: S-layer homology domain-containing protein [Lawsonibacter sp.]|jgi:hypothetical protein